MDLIPKLFLDNEYSDITLKVETEGSNEQLVFPAHSLLLKLASPIFKAMLEDEKFVEGRTKTATIKTKGDINEALIFLRYLYTREMDNLDMNAYMSTIQTAHLYLVDSLVNLCSERMVSEATPLNICRVYAMLVDIASEDLVKHCKDLMLRYAFMIFNRNLHLTLREDMMKFLLSSNDLNVLDETQALEALWGWGCAKRIQDSACNINTTQPIQNLVHLIRWPLVTNVPESSPWFGLWKTYSAATETGFETNTTSEKRTPVKSKLDTLISDFAEVSFQNVGNHIMVILKAGIPVKTVLHSVPKLRPGYTSWGSVEFLVDRFIMWTGLSLYFVTNVKIRLKFELEFDGKDITNYLCSQGPSVETIFSKENNSELFQKVRMDFITPLRVDKLKHHSIKVFYLNETSFEQKIFINDFSYTSPEPTNPNTPRLTLLGTSKSICEFRYFV